MRPYVFDFRTNAKGRWYGRRLLEVFTAEFAAHKPEYYRAAIDQGRITVNGAAVGLDYVLRGGDAIAHFTHRHEPPVRGLGQGELEVVADTPQLLAVNKPATVPMHPCGAYRFNSLFHVVDSERKAAGVASEVLHIVHRLDRLTSGLTLFAKDPDTAKRFGADLVAGHCHKTYLARVAGDFGAGLVAHQGWWRPLADLEADEQALGWAAFHGASLQGAAASASALGAVGDAEAAVAAATGGAWVRVQQPVGCVSHKDGVYECSYEAEPTLRRTPKDLGGAQVAASAKDAKEATTLVRKLSFNGRTSLVECRPVHGRTHQIRLHLRFLGHPIANDPSYGGVLNYGDPTAGIPPEDPLLDPLLAALGNHAPQSLPAQAAAAAAAAATTASSSATIEATAADGGAVATPAVAVAAAEPAGPFQDPVPCVTGAAVRPCAETSTNQAEWYAQPRREGEDLGPFLVRTCSFCHAGRLRRRAAAGGGIPAASPSGPSDAEHSEAAVFDEERMHCSGIWLHALTYERADPASPTNDWSFSTSHPKWAQEGFLEEEAEEVPG